MRGQSIRPDFLPAHSKENGVAVPTRSIQQALARCAQSGVASLSQRGLRELPMELFDLSKAQIEGVNWWECNALTKMDISYNEISAIPEAVSSLEDLSVVIGMHNRFDALPEALFKLPSLKCLHFAHNRLTSLPGSMANCTSLVDLDFSCNSLSTMPCVAKLTNLESLQLDGNDLTMLPDGTEHLARLSKLSVSKNQLESLPDGIGDLGHLRELNVHANKVAALPSSITKLHSLVLMDVSENRLTALDHLPRSEHLDSICAADNHIRTMDGSQLEHTPNLTVLDLKGNHLKRLDEGVGHLTRLKTLDLTNNALPNLPNALGSLESLTRLLIDGNIIRCIRPEVLKGPVLGLKKYLRGRSESSGLDVPNGASGAGADTEQDDAMATRIRTARATRELNLSKMMSERNRVELWRLSTSIEDLEAFTVSDNGIAELPEAISRWDRLQKLIADHNKLTALPPALWHLSSLRELDVSYNTIRSIAPPTATMRHLAHVNLSCNQLAAFPADLIDAAPKLQELRVAYNQIASVAEGPAEAYTPHRALETLDLTNNRITACGEGLMVAFPKMRTLILANNDLRGIPFAWGLWESLQALSLDGNPLKALRSSVLHRGTIAVKDYLASRLPEGYTIPTPKQPDQPQSPTPHPAAAGGATAAAAGSPPRRHDPHDVARVEALEKKIRDLEDEVANPVGLTGAEQRALKKELDDARAELADLQKYMV
ncbi:unnamed protein product [Vitrella brassicaformis CCMP3155]|uniref:Uncharacterized protein n=1 Tax=Vitrella brassicaformis (strain CCMP3155) TaxID=1169540 RepID=A0A0G4ECL8_VITBC|nr:unnamed protein product [Vitrella brassicaformis CCMP3155]|mmetsp:Transcript_43483/g.108582  ORF Transcript_43483/g.108582 Transcript_43483/m.108582 type:complete len:715 (-) Transcript_43483:215-2359(-)|eukprot:CEL93719.1 unnamed protein product [Vitrella brassicaformis CCMP3155]